MPFKTPELEDWRNDGFDCHNFSTVDSPLSLLSTKRLEKDFCRSQTAQGPTLSSKRRPYAKQAQIAEPTGTGVSNGSAKSEDTGPDGWTRARRFCSPFLCPVNAVQLQSLI
jgi:hypothetical protein